MIMNKVSAAYAMKRPAGFGAAYTTSQKRGRTIGLGPSYGIIRSRTAARSGRRAWGEMEQCVVAVRHRRLPATDGDNQNCWPKRMPKNRGLIVKVRDDPAQKSIEQKVFRVS